jgi:hypothetical protein
VWELTVLCWLSMDRAPLVNESSWVGGNEALWGFTSDEEVMEVVHTWLREQLKSFFSAGIQKLVDWYNKCIVLQGDCVAKWYVKLLTVTSVKAVKCFLILLFHSPSYSIKKRINYWLYLWTLSRKSLSQKPVQMVSNARWRECSLQQKVGQWRRLPRLML